MSQVIQTPEQQVYLYKLLEYDYSIQYKSKKSNIVADALSRVLESKPSHCFILSMPNFIFWKLYAKLYRLVIPSKHWLSRFKQTLLPNQTSSYTMAYYYSKGKFGWTPSIPFGLFQWKNIIPHPWEVTWALPKLCINFSRTFIGLICVRRCNNLFNNASPVSNPNTRQKVRLVCSSPSLSLLLFGKTYHWISL